MDYFMPKSYQKRNKAINRKTKMKKEYDFSKGVRGKFYNKDVKTNLPIYLEPDIQSLIENIASKKKQMYQK
jgi:hypothetical protein